MVRTKYIDEKGKYDVVNRFGLETENSGKVQLNLNICFQNAVVRKSERMKAAIIRESTQLEAKKQVMHFKLKIKEDTEAERIAKMRRQQQAAFAGNTDGGVLDDKSEEYKFGEDENEY